MHTSIQISYLLGDTSTVMSCQANFDSVVHVEPLWMMISLSSGREKVVYVSSIPTTLCGAYLLGQESTATHERPRLTKICKFKCFGNLLASISLVSTGVSQLVSQLLKISINQIQTLMEFLTSPQVKGPLFESSRSADSRSASDKDEIHARLEHLETVRDTHTADLNSILLFMIAASATRCIEHDD